MKKVLSASGRILLVAVLALQLAACSAVPESIQPVSDFDVQRYMGRWYEIARLDHRFERGMDQVTASYSLNEDGTVRVVNRGRLIDSGEWKEAVGKARFAGSSDTGYLEVSFFGPLYGAYVIFELDQDDYQYAFVTGSEDTLWLLARTSTVSDALKERFVAAVAAAGYEAKALIFVDQAP